MEPYRYECATPAGFVQRVVVLAQCGYRFFVQGEVPERKAVERVDDKILSKYGVRKTRRQRAYRKARGLSNAHYFRHGRAWVLMATSPDFVLAVDAKERVRDLRKTPIRAHGYSVALRRDGSAMRRGEHRERASVRLDEETYRNLKRQFECIALRRSTERLRAEFWRQSSRWQVYAPVRRQFLALLRRVNDRRQAAGLSRLCPDCIRACRPWPPHFSPPPSHSPGGHLAR